MIHLITAVPGSGKTLYCVQLIKNLVESDSPRLVYHNIKDLSIDSPLILPAPDDWRECKDGAVIIYDEAQELFPATGQAGRVNDTVLTDLETHRHRGLDIYFVTQHPTFVHHHIRKLVGWHLHLYRSNGVSASVTYTWSHSVLEPNDRKEQIRADVNIFKFPKELFKFYKSTVLNTHKFKMPKKGWFFILALLVIFGLVSYSLSDGLNVLQEKGAQAEAQPAAPSSLLPSVSGSDNVSRETIKTWSDSPEVTPVLGCAHFPSKQRCVCYSSNGLPLNMSYAKCVSAMGSPLPFNITASGGGSNSGGGAAVPPPPASNTGVSF